jgi:hypothetical protein
MTFRHRHLTRAAWLGEACGAVRLTENAMAKLDADGKPVTLVGVCELPVNLVSVASDFRHPLFCVIPKRLNFSDSTVLPTKSDNKK